MIQIAPSILRSAKERVYGSKYFILVFFIIVYLLFIPYSQGYFGQIFLSAIVSVVLVIAGFSVKQEKTIGSITLRVVLVTLAFVWFFTIQGSMRSEELVRFFTAISFSLIGVLIFINIIRTTRKKTVEMDFIWGGVSTYLLIGLAFASVYRLIEIYAPGSFSSSAIPPKSDFSNFIYFSYYALTTIGGLMTPNTLQAQSLVMLEPVIGTLFIAIFISRLVDIAGNKEKHPPQNEVLKTGTE
ncbi:MAG: ion channel [Candidatus Bathyarchaeota archaeon]|nr:ion channel [Candidatus Bathyarchaeota archaeon]